HQRARWLTPVLAGDQVGCFMVTEPHHPAGDFAALTTSLRKIDTRYSLNGRKSQVGNGPIPDGGLVYTPIEDPTDPMAQAFVLVDMRRSGVYAERQQRHLALRAMPWAEVRFSDYQVDPDEILVSSLNSPGFSLWGAMKEVDWGKILVFMAS